MYQVYEIAEGLNDLFRFEHEDHFECEIWIAHHIYEHPKTRTFEIREV